MGGVEEALLSLASLQTKLELLQRIYVLTLNLAFFLLISFDVISVPIFNPLGPILPTLLEQDLDLLTALTTRPLLAISQPLLLLEPPLNILLGHHPQPIFIAIRKHGRVLVLELLAHDIDFILKFVIVHAFHLVLFEFVNLLKSCLLFDFDAL